MEKGGGMYKRVQKEDRNIVISTTSSSSSSCSVPTLHPLWISGKIKQDLAAVGWMKTEQLLHSMWLTLRINCEDMMTFYTLLLLINIEDHADNVLLLSLLCITYDEYGWSICKAPSQKRRWSIDAEPSMSYLAIPEPPSISTVHCVDTTSSTANTHKSHAINFHNTKRTRPLKLVKFS